MATSPAYFRGFILIALKEGREGTTDDDYLGQYQVRRGRCTGREAGQLHAQGALSSPAKFAKDELICMP